MHEDHKAAWLVSPWQENGNLRDYLKNAPPNQKERVRLASDSLLSRIYHIKLDHLKAFDVAKGLAYLHNQKPPVCHGQVKPVGPPLRKHVHSYGIGSILHRKTSS